VDSYDIQRFLHIGVIIVALGATFALPFAQGLGEKRGVGATRFAHELGQRLEKFLIIPGAVIVFLTGIGLIFEEATPYDDDFPAWLGVGIAWFLVAFAVAIFIQRRNGQKALKTLEGLPDNAELPEDYKPIGKQMQMVGGLLGLSVIGITLLMIWKPGQ
jgi:uncharacterized membrane protein